MTRRLWATADDRAECYNGFKKVVRGMALILETPVKEEVLTPEEELRILEEEAMRLGISPQEFARIRAIGRCPSQVRTEIALLQRWISDRLG